MEGQLPLEVSVDRARLLIEDGVPVLDVRSRAERGAKRLRGSVWIPIEAVAERWRELPGSGALVVQCSAGTRSFRATKFLREKGLEATSMVGGLSEWMALGLPLDFGPEAADGGAPS